MFRMIFWLIYEILYLIAVTPEMFFCLHLRKKGETERFRRITEKRVTHWARHMLSAAGITVEVHGLENMDGRPAVIVGNHQSDWDIPVVLGCLDKPHGIVAKDSIAKIPLIRTWMRFIGCVFIDRSDARKSLRTINDAAGRLKDGDSLLIFPEGTRSKGEEIGEFKSGAFKTAFRYGAPVIPFSIDGTYKIMEGNEKKGIRPGHIILTVLPPVETAGMDRQRQKDLGEEIRRMILEARMESRKKSRQTNGSASDFSGYDKAERTGGQTDR